MTDGSGSEESDSLNFKCSLGQEEEQRRRADLESQLGVYKTEFAAKEKMIKNLSDMMMTEKELNESTNTTKAETDGKDGINTTLQYTHKNDHGYL